MIASVHSGICYACRRRPRRSSLFVSAEPRGQCNWLAEGPFAGSDCRSTRRKWLFPFDDVPHCLVGRRRRTLWCRYQRQMMWSLPVVVHQHRISRQARGFSSPWAGLLPHLMLQQQKRGRNHTLGVSLRGQEAKRRKVETQRRPARACWQMNVWSWWEEFDGPWIKLWTRWEKFQGRSGLWFSLSGCILPMVRVSIRHSGDKTLCFVVVGASGKVRGLLEA